MAKHRILTEEEHAKLRGYAQMTGADGRRIFTDQDLADLFGCHRETVIRYRRTPVGKMPKPGQKKAPQGNGACTRQLECDQSS